MERFLYSYWLIPFLAQKTAAKEAHQREAEKQDAKESQQVQDLAQQQLAKATAAFSAEIEAVAGPEEAGACPWHDN